MGNIVAVICGAVAIMLGLFGLIGWWCSFVELLKGSIPPILILGGLLAIAIAVSNIKDDLKAKSEEKPGEGK